MTEVGRRWNGWGDAAIDAPLQPAAMAFLAQRDRRRDTGARREPRRRRSAQVEAQPSRLPPHRADRHRRRGAAARELRPSRGTTGCALRFGVLGRRHRRRRLARERRRGARAARLGARPRRSRPALRRRDQRRRPSRRRPARRRSWCQARPDDAAARARPGVPARALRGRRRRARSRSAAARARLHPRPLPAELRVLDARRLDRDALVGPAVGALRPDRAALRRAAAADARRRMARCRRSRRRPPAPTCASGCSAPKAASASSPRRRVRVSRQPERERFVGVFFPTGQRARDAVRELAQARLGAVDAAPRERRRDATDAGDGRPRRRASAARALPRLARRRRRQVPAARRLQRRRGARSRAMQRRAARDLAPRTRGVSTGTVLGAKWAARRFAGVYLRNGLWDAGYAVETMETACDWPRVDAMIAAIEGAGRAALARDGERVHAYTHLSHVYRAGLERLQHLRLPHRRRLRDRPRALARAQGRGQRGDRRRTAERSAISTASAATTCAWLGAEKGAAGIAALRGDGRALRSARRDGRRPSRRRRRRMSDEPGDGGR